MRIQEGNRKKWVEESYLLRIPVLGYFFRKIRENREAIEQVLKTGKKTEGEIKKNTFLWIFKIVSRKKFEILKLKKKKK